jgi:hypothetical protein
VYTHRHWPQHEADDKTAQRQTASLASIVIILLLLVGGLFLVQQLRNTARIEDCMMAGRSNCDVAIIGKQ